MNRFIGLSGLLSLAACQHSPALAPSLEPADLPLLSSLPADAPLIVGGHAPALLEAPWAGALAPELEARFAEVSGAPADALGALAGACTDEGCALVVAGDAARLSLPRLGALSPAAHLRGDGIDATGEDGVRYRLRLLPGRALLGHDAAVARLGAGDGGLDPQALAGRIPDGDLWIYARDQEAFAAQAAAWIRSSGSDAMRAQLPAWEAQHAARPEVIRAVSDVALSIDADEATARLRLTCTSAAEAAVLAAALRVERQRQLARQPEPVAEALAQTTLARAGAQIELTFAPDGDLLEELLR